MQGNVTSLLNFKVDLVVLWVNSADLNWQKKYLTYFPETQFLTSPRYSQNYELVFALRSIEKNLPWINKIYIITDAQKPEWLVENTKLKVIDHSEIIPSEYLPLFNSEAIETFIHLIPNLEEHFIYINDDMFFNHPLSKDFFFFSDGIPKIRVKKLSCRSSNNNLYYDNIINSNIKFNSKFSTSFSLELSHGADAYLKSKYGECLAEMKEEIEELRKQKRRGNSSAQRIIHSLYLLKSFPKALQPYKQVEREFTYLSLNREDLSQFSKLTRNSSVVCVNEDERSNWAGKRLYPILLRNLFPCTSSNEKKLKYTLSLPIEPDTNYFCTSCDENYAPYVFATIKSLKNWLSDTSKGCLFVLHTDITPETQSELSKLQDKSLVLRFVDITKYLLFEFSEYGFPVREYWSISTYFKCFVPLIFQEIDQILFIDSDICFNNSPLGIFKEEALSSSKIAAVLDSASPLLSAEYPDRYEKLKELGVRDPENTYFNAGVILFRNYLIDSKEYTIQLEKTFSLGKLLFQDQDILNIIFNNNTQLLELKYNFQCGVLLFNKNYLSKIGELNKDKWEQAEKKAIIVHYTGSKKPWNSTSVRFFELFWKNFRDSPHYERTLLDIPRVQQKSSLYDRLSQQIVLKKFSYFFLPLGSVRREYIKKLLKRFL